MYVFDYLMAMTTLKYPEQYHVKKKFMSLVAFHCFLMVVCQSNPSIDGLMRLNKIDKHDYSQLIAVGDDMVGAVTVKEGIPISSLLLILSER